MTEEARVREPGQDAVPEARARPLLTDLVNELSVSPTGVAFIASCLDRLGHQGGDTVLRQVGEQLRHGLRAGDIAARVGGDEFALLLHIDGLNSIDAILDRLHGHEGFGDAGTITWTAGMAMCPDEASTVDDLYRFADQRLYEAKHASKAPKRTSERATEA